MAKQYAEPAAYTSPSGKRLHGVEEREVSD